MRVKDRLDVSLWLTVLRPRVMTELIRQAALLYGVLGRWPGRPRGAIRAFRRFRFDTYSPSGSRPPFRAVVEFAVWSSEERRAARSQFARQR